MENKQYIPADDESIEIKKIRQCFDDNGCFLEIEYKMDSMRWTGAIHKTYINAKSGYITGYDVKLY